jgi:signal peptidase
MTIPKAFVVTLVLLLAAVSVVVFLMGGRVLVIRSGSMEPALRPGDAIVLQPDHGRVAVGSVITYQHQEQIITHRVTAVEGDGNLRTKGDANEEEDAWQVSPAALKGEMWFRVPYLGYLVVFLRQPTVWFPLVILPAVWIVLSELATARRIIIDWRVGPHSTGKQ